MMESQFNLEALMSGFLGDGYLECNPPALQELSIAAYKLLLDGKTITPADIAVDMGIEPKEISKLFELIPECAYESDDRTGITAFIGLSITRTNHEFIIADRTLHTWCVLDGLFLPQVIGRSAIIKTKCPATGTEIHVELYPKGITSAAPEDMVMSVVDPDRDACCENLRGAFCNHVNFFANKGTFMEWADGKPEYGCVTLAAAYQMAMARNRARFPDIDLKNAVSIKPNIKREDLNEGH